MLKDPSASTCSGVESSSFTSDSQRSFLSKAAARIATNTTPDPGKHQARAGANELRNNSTQYEADSRHCRADELQETDNARLKAGGCELLDSAYERYPLDTVA